MRAGCAVLGRIPRLRHLGVVLAKSLFDGLTAAVLHAIISSVVRFGLLAQLVEHTVMFIQLKRR